MKVRHVVVGVTDEGTLVGCTSGFKDPHADYERTRTFLGESNADIAAGILQQQHPDWVWAVYRTDDPECPIALSNGENQGLSVTYYPLKLVSDATEAKTEETKGNP